MRSRFYFYVDACLRASRLSTRGESGGDVLPVNHLSELSGDDVVEPLDFGVAKNGDRLVYSQISDGKRFFKVVDPEPVGMMRSHGGNHIDAVAVGVCLHNRHHSRAW